MKCLAFEPAPKGTLLGYATIETGNGIVFHEVQIHGNGIKMWCLMPSKHRPPAGPIIAFKDDSTREKFKALVVTCASQYLRDTMQ